MYRLIIIGLLAAASGGRGAGLSEPTQSPVAQHMHVAVEQDRVRIGDNEFVPRFTDLPSVLVVPAGETVTLPPSSTWDTIEVAGTLRVSHRWDTTVRFTHLMILPGGRLDAGTESNPVLRQVEFIVRDGPLDTSRDPFQWGNGILNFGTQTRVGQRKTPFVELAEDAPSGATQLTLAEVPEGWQAGDVLLLPDTRQLRLTRGAEGPRRDVDTAIAAISGTTVTLTRPLGFARASIRDPDGGLVLRPRVANLTRNIVIRSENPAGTRGHSANIGGAASWDLQFNAFRGFGRTRNETLDSTSPDLLHIGTNQVGKYANHDHHAGSVLAVRRNVGNSYVGDGLSKWAHAIHGTHGAVVEDNVCVGVAGSCFVTEDGWEMRNAFRRNFAAYSDGQGAAVDNVRNKACPGCEGTGFWLHGIQGIVEDNEAWNNRASGLNLFNQDFVGVEGRLVPSVPGGEPDTPFDPRGVPQSVRGNVTAANDDTGLEFWSTASFPVDDHIAAHNGAKQVWAAASQSVHMDLRNLVALGSGENPRSMCVASSAAYVTRVEIDGGHVRGCEVGISGGIAAQGGTFRNVTFQNVTNIIYTRQAIGETVWENVMHLPLGTHPRRYIVLRDGSVWKPGKPVPRGKGDHWVTNSGASIAIINWQDSGQDYRLLEPQQNRQTAAWPATNDFPVGVPAAGLTMGEAWDRYGLAYGGDVYQEGQVVDLEGLINGVARPGLDRPLGLPRAVLTFPNMLSPAEVTLTRRGPEVVLHLVLTGHSESANKNIVIAIDGEEPVRLPPGRRRRGMQHTYSISAVEPGTHVVRTWREDLKGVRIAASELTFRYVVASTGG